MGKENLSSLIKEGERLLPLGGNILDGYNGKNQSEYISWRLQVHNFFENLGKSGKIFIQEMESESDIKYLYKSSVTHILGVLQGAKKIINSEKNGKEYTKKNILEQDIELVWGPLRSVLETHFSFSSIKEIVGLAGINPLKIANLQQKSGIYVSKGQLMTALDNIIMTLTKEEKKRFITIATEEILTRIPSLEDKLVEYLSRLGWSINQKVIIPIEIFDLSDLPILPEEARPDLLKATLRLRDGDLSGAISSACGAVDATTSIILRKKNIEQSISFQGKVMACVKAIEFKDKLKVNLQDLGWEEKEIKPFLDNLSSSINSAAYVMQTLRAQMGDVHGSKPILKPLVFDSIKWAALILRLLT